MSKLLDLSNPVFSSYVLWSSILVLKMLAMSVLTAVQRFKNKVSRQLTLFFYIIKLKCRIKVVPFLFCIAVTSNRYRLFHLSAVTRPYAPM